MLGSVLVCTKGRPWSEAGQKPGDMPAVLAIFVAETESEKRLLQQWNVDQVNPEKSEGPKGMRSGPQQHRLRRKDNDDARDHGISDVSIRSLNNEVSGRVPWREGSLAFGGEATSGREKEEQADQKRHDPSCLKDESPR